MMMMVNNRMIHKIVMVMAMAMVLVVVVNVAVLVLVHVFVLVFVVVVLVEQRLISWKGVILKMMILLYRVVVVVAVVVVVDTVNDDTIVVPVRKHGHDLAHGDTHVHTHGVHVVVVVGGDVVVTVFLVFDERLELLGEIPFVVVVVNAMVMVDAVVMMRVGMDVEQDVEDDLCYHMPY